MVIGAMENTLNSKETENTVSAAVYDEFNT